MSFDFTSLANLLQKQQEQFRCSRCQQLYQKKWFRPELSICFFCHRFSPLQHTYRSLLREAEWAYVQSGEDSPQEYYNNYIEYLHHWCNYYRISPEKGDLQYERELCST